MDSILCHLRIDSHRCWHRCWHRCSIATRSVFRAVSDLQCSRRSGESAHVTRSAHTSTSGMLPVAKNSASLCWPDLVIALMYFLVSLFFEHRPSLLAVIPGSIIISVCALGGHSRTVKMHGGIMSGPPPPRAKNTRRSPTGGKLSALTAWPFSEHSYGMLLATGC